MRKDYTLLITGLVLGLFFGTMKPLNSFDFSRFKKFTGGAKKKVSKGKDILGAAKKTRRIKKNLEKDVKNLVEDAKLLYQSKNQLINLKNTIDKELGEVEKKLKKTEKDIERTKKHVGEIDEIINVLKN